MRTLSISLLWLASACAGLAAAEDVQIDTISLERTACRGTCPIYKIMVRRDGSVTYEGKEFVKVTGDRSRKVTAQEFQQLASEIKRIGFFQLKDEYLVKQNPDGSTEGVTDLPTTIITVQAGELRKQVKDYYGAPDSLRRLEHLIDTISGSAAWIGKET